MAGERLQCEHPQTQCSESPLPQSTHIHRGLRHSCKMECPFQGKRPSELRILLTKQEVISQETPTDDSHARDTETFVTTVPC